MSGWIDRNGWIHCPTLSLIHISIHLATVELLEKQPDHGKAQYIANAVVFYDTHFADDPQPLRAEMCIRDREIPVQLAS